MSAETWIARHAAVLAQLRTEGMHDREAEIAAFYIVVGERAADASSTFAAAEEFIQAAGLRVGKERGGPRWKFGIAKGCEG
jgi:hypothetical protein